MRLFNVRTPGNINAFNAYFDEVTSVKIFDPENAMMQLTYTPEQEPFSLNF